MKIPQRHNVCSGRVDTHQIEKRECLTAAQPVLLVYHIMQGQESLARAIFFQVSKKAESFLVIEERR